MNLSDVPFMLFPVLGLISVFLAGAVSLVVIRILKLPPEKAASVFTAGMFTNVLTFGGLIGFVFFGEIGYPVSHNIGNRILSRLTGRFSTILITTTTRTDGRAVSPAWDRTTSTRTPDRETASEVSVRTPQAATGDPNGAFGRKFRPLITLTS